MANAPSKPYKGCGMEGLVVAWYARQTARDGEEIRHTARCIAAYLNSGSRILEVAPGPGYLAIELTRLSGAFVTGLDISRSFVGITRENASKAGARVDFRAWRRRRPAVCRYSVRLHRLPRGLQEFARPLVALNEMHRVLKPGGNALIIDLRKDFLPRAVKDYARRHGLFADPFIRLTFNTVLKKRAYTKDSITELVAQSQFGQGEVRVDPIGFELWLHK